MVDADDILFGMEMAFDPAYNNNKHKTAWGDIEGVKAWAENPTESITDASGVTKIDEMTVQIAIERPDNNWWASGSKVFAMPRHHFAGLDKAIATEARAVDLLGNGPMIFERYVTQQFADLTANKDWAYGAPYVDDYVVRYGDGAALDAATEANEQPNPIDFHRAAGGIEAFARLAAQAHLRPFPQRSPFASGVFLNQTAEIFADMTLEQQSMLIEAMVLAVDREQLNNELHGGTRFISDYIFEHVALLSDPPEGTFRDLSYNPDAARELLAEANWDTNKVIKWMRWRAPAPRDLAIKAYWDEVGIQTEFLIIDGSAVIAKLYQERVHDLVFANMGGDQNPVDACLRICSDRLYELGGWNHSNINRPWIDEAYAAILGAANAEERREAWLDMATRLHARGEMVYGQFSRGSLLNLYPPPGQGRVLDAELRHSRAVADQPGVDRPVLGRAVARTATPLPRAAAPAASEEPAVERPPALRRPHSPVIPAKGEICVTLRHSREGGNPPFIESGGGEDAPGRPRGRLDCATVTSRCNLRGCPFAGPLGLPALPQPSTPTRVPASPLTCPSSWIIAALFPAPVDGAAR